MSPKCVLPSFKRRGRHNKPIHILTCCVKCGLRMTLLLFGTSLKSRLVTLLILLLSILTTSATITRRSYRHGNFSGQEWILWKGRSHPSIKWDCMPLIHSIKWDCMHRGLVSKYHVTETVMKMFYTLKLS